MQSVVVLGATGSVGVNTLDVLARHRDRFRVLALTAHGNHERLLEQCLTHRPDYAVMVQADAARKLEARLQDAGLPTRVLAGTDGLATVASLEEADIVMAAIVGAAGLLPTLAAVRAGKRVLLANKEALVMCGALFMRTVQESGAELLPIDSEHNAIFQCLPTAYRPGQALSGVRSITLTASGGPFRGWAADALEDVTPEQACQHPTWSMGRKISVDSATLMNKGLELIEAGWLFGVEPHRLRVVLHPESIVHSMVEFEDSSVIAQLGQPDMRTPIASGLAWPERLDAGVDSLDPVSMGALHFEAPDREAFPCLRLAETAMTAGGGMPAVLNAANEVAVADFLAGRAGFGDIPRAVEAALEAFDGAPAGDLENTLALDAEVRAWMDGTGGRGTERETGP